MRRRGEGGERSLIDGMLHVVSIRWKHLRDTSIPETAWDSTRARRHGAGGLPDEQGGARGNFREAPATAIECCRIVRSVFPSTPVPAVENKRARGHVWHECGGGGPFCNISGKPSGNSCEHHHMVKGTTCRSVEFRNDDANGMEGGPRGQAPSKGSI